MKKEQIINLSDTETLNLIKKYFCIEEFVSPEVFNKYGETSWQFICPRLLRTILLVRTNLDKPMTINNWKWNGSFTQRGLRENTSNIVSSKTNAGKMYLSAHTMGKAVDFDVKGMEAEEVRMWLKEHAEELPYHIRLEHNMKGKPISWVHLDVFFNPNNPKVYLFDV
jgi:hypothetical protein